MLNRQLKRKKFTFLSIFVIWLLVVVDMYFLLNNIESKDYKYLYLLPLSYAISMSIFLPLIEKTCIYKRGVIYYLAQIVLAYRYLLLPLACMYTEINGGWTASATSGFGIEPKEESMFLAILWMCSEIFVAECTIYIAMKVIAKMENKRKLLIKNISLKEEFFKRSVLVKIYIICAFILLIVFQPQLFSQFMILDDNFSVGDNSADGSFFKVIFLAFKFCFLMIGFSFCAKKYKKGKNYIWLVISICFLIIYIGYSIGISRWSMILPTIASIVILKRIYNIPKMFIAIVMFIMFLGVLNMTYFKYGYLLDSNQNSIISIILIVFQQSNEYISGPRSIAQGLEMLDVYNNSIGISTFFNSFFSGFAGLASLTNDANKLQSFFNYYAIGIALEDKPLICPIIIEGIAFFPIFPWIFICIFEFMACILDYKSKVCFNYEDVFLILYIGLWFSLCFNGNTKTEMAQLSQIIPCIILFKLNRIIGWKN